MHNRLLLVDDEADILTLMKRGLEMAGYQVEAFIDPKEALSHFQKDHYDLVLLDIRMPGMNGFQLLREIVKLDDKPKLCFMTAFDIYLDEAKKLFPTLKIDLFLKKPMRIKELANAVHEALNR